MERLKRMREPAAFVVLAVLWAQLLVDLIWFLLYVRSAPGSLSSLALAMSNRVLETLTIVVLALLVAGCRLGDRTRHVRLLTVLALTGSVLMIMTALSLGALGLAAPGVTTTLDLLELVLALVVPVIVVVGLVLLLRSPTAEADVPEAVADADHETAQPALPSPRQEPVWQPDAASGVAWHTAGDAAVGAPAAGWGTPGDSGGWDPIPDESEQPPASRTGGES